MEAEEWMPLSAGSQGSCKGRQLVRARGMCVIFLSFAEGRCGAAEVLKHGLRRRGRCLSRVGVRTVSSWTLPGEQNSDSVTNIRITLDCNQNGSMIYLLTIHR